MDETRGTDELFWIDYANELWQCPTCNVWVSFRDSQSCPVCNREAPDPVFQWNAKQRDRRSKYTLGFQIKVAFYAVGAVLGIVSIVSWVIMWPAVLPIGGAFLIWVLLWRAVSGKKKKDDS